MLINATRYTEPGGEIELKVFAGSQWDNSEAVFVVKDNGRGIAADLMSSIFGMFIQGGDKRNISGAGLGVGLALARSIAELHRGRLKGSSAGVGKGSEFTMYIPLAPFTTTAPDVKATQTVQAGKLNILVVDDNEDAASLLASFLESVGHQSVTASNGNDALALFDRHHPDLVLLDIGMPGMNGYELARRIRQHPYGKATKLVAVTGWGKDEDRYRSKEAGIDVHLVKPVENEEILALVDTAGLAANR